MKKRAISLFLALILMFSALPLPASAASAKDVYNYLKEFPLHGDYDSSSKTWMISARLNSESELYYAIRYLESSQYLELCIYDSTAEIVWRVSSNPSPAYNGYIRVYDDANSKGTVSLFANYNGESFSSFSSFSGNSELRNGMLNAVSELMPLVVEATRLLLQGSNYTLADLGMTGYKRCNYYHNFDNGRVTSQPTCSKTGTMLYTCTLCGSSYTEEIPTNDVHTWGAGEVVLAPTCTETGVMRYTCTACKSATTDQDIPALGHVWTVGEELEAGAEPHSRSMLYVCTRCGDTKKGDLCAKEVFTDMPKKSHWAHAAIDWAYFNGITGGTTPTTFSPKKTVTRAEAVTFLYAIYGKPAVEASNPFKDVKTKDYFYNAVLWAVDKGVTSGTKEDRFSPKQECSRAETVMFLWAAAGRPAPESTENPFRDVKSKQYYYNAVLWASENGITSGIDATHFAPKNNCTRAELMVFLMTAYPFLMNDPADPSDPGEPVDPVDPVDPADPTDPVDPADPGDPVDPADPTDPVDPTDPGEPTDSVEPGDLTDSADPIDPSQIQP